MQRNDLDVVVRLIDGAGEPKEWIFRAGQARTPLSVGTEGQWRVRAVGVAPAHFALAFNGTTLFVAATGGRTLLNGQTLGAQWTEVSQTSELRFGHAKISVAQRLADAHTKLKLYQTTAAQIPALTADVKKFASAGETVAPADQGINFMRAIQSQSAQSGVQLQNISRQLTHDSDAFFVEQVVNINVPPLVGGRSWLLCHCPQCDYFCCHPIQIRVE